LSGSFLFWADVVRDLAIVVFVLVWIASVAWVVRDARSRGVSRLAAGALAAALPFAGAFLYTLVRPGTRLDEARERKLWLELARSAARSRAPYCHNCGTQVEREYVVCPVCAEELRRRCDGCGAANDFAWAACPYCGAQEEGDAWVEQAPARAIEAEVTELKPAAKRRRRAEPTPPGSPPKAPSESAV
jgi:hypothetical protein